MYKIQRYSIREDIEARINNFCIEGEWEVVSVYHATEFLIAVVYKKVKNENKSKGNN